MGYNLSETFTELYFFILNYLTLSIRAGSFQMYLICFIQFSGLKKSIFKKILHLNNKPEKFAPAVVILTDFRDYEVDSDEFFYRQRQVGHEEREDEGHLDLAGQARAKVGYKNEDCEGQNQKNVGQTDADRSADRVKQTLKKL